MKYTKQYQNQSWLYTVWRSEHASDYILAAIHPGVGWQDVVIQLSTNEVEVLRQSEDEFTTFVKRIVSEREIPAVKNRRIESRVRIAGPDELIFQQ